MVSPRWHIKIFSKTRCIPALPAHWKVGNKTGLKKVVLKNLKRRPFNTAILIMNVIGCLFNFIQFTLFFLLKMQNAIWSVQKQSRVVFCQIGVLKILQVFKESTCVGVTFLKSCTHLGPQLYSKETLTQTFSNKICNNFRNNYFEEHLWRTAFECYYNGEKVLRNSYRFLETLRNT